MLTFRKANLEDLEEIQQLFVDTVSSICINDYNQEQINVWIAAVENKQRWLDILEKQYFLIAQESNKIVGYGSLENGNYIDLLYVHKDFQRRGIADKIFDKLEREAIESGATTITSDVSKTAKPFFEKKGFKVILEQINLRKGVEIVNFKMKKSLDKAKKAF